MTHAMKIVLEINRKLNPKQVEELAKEITKRYGPEILIHVDVQSVECVEFHE